ncbi:MAG: DNA-protecting protein DprA [Nitrosopumilus sp.]|uniref:DNA-processing protein DprA n=1 Tax=Nitrosopumilus sp. TaxID=2024843 RepID=UPI00246E2445|nr:DNA-processing protein DprA [Nitrosopumilus sp.]MDH5431107.1 DNA-protecting protein DprA [Nitrosopumilus sp.]
MVEAEYPSIQLENLLGRPLNDIESKFKPKIIFYEGSMEIPVPCPRVSIIGSRDASAKGLSEAKEISKILIENGVVIVSGLAKGIDTVGHKTAIEYGGKTIAVIGTPLNKVYPKENFELQEEIMKNHLVISQYPVGHPTTPKDFVLRNRTMALISDATVIVEAGESSGSLHQGWETLRIGRPLFICKDVVENDKLEWPEKMIQYGAMKLDESTDILENLPTGIKMPELFQ